MFSLSTEYGNTLDLADCVLNSLEIESPFAMIVEFGFDFKARKLSDKSISNYLKQLRYLLR